MPLYTQDEVEVLRSHHNSRFTRIITLLEDLKMNQTEMATALNGVNDQLVKVAGETSTLIQTVADLKTVILSGPVTPELQAAFDKVAAQAKIVDDLVPDPVPVTP